MRDIYHEQMIKRKLHKVFQIACRTRINYDLVRYLRNKVGKYKLHRAQATEVAYPSCIMLELTNHCNLQCATCPRQYAYGKNMDKGYMSLENAKKIVDEIYPYLDSIGLTGLGETMLYPHLTEIASYIKSKKKSVVISLSTNANVAGFEETVKTVMPYIDTMQISIDGIEEVYEKIRVGAKFELLKANLLRIIELANRCNVDLMFNMVITKENYSQMGDVIKFADEISVKYVNFNYFNLVSVTDIGKDYYEFYRTKEFEQALTNVYEMSKKYKGIEVTGLDFRDNTGLGKCPFPWDYFYITWDGWVVPCCAKPFPKLMNFGNVYANGVMPVLNSDKYKHFRENWIQDKCPDFCEKCHFIDL